MASLISLTLTKSEVLECMIQAEPVPCIQSNAWDLPESLAILRHPHRILVQVAHPQSEIPYLFFLWKMSTNMLS